jgi:hypothetical protein
MESNTTLLYIYQPRRSHFLEDCDLCSFYILLILNLFICLNPSSFYHFIERGGGYREITAVVVSVGDGSYSLQLWLSNPNLQVEPHYFGFTNCKKFNHRRVKCRKADRAIITKITLLSVPHISLRIVGICKSRKTWKYGQQPGNKMIAGENQQQLKLQTDMSDNSQLFV